MAIILTYIETETVPSPKFSPLPIPSATPQKTYTKIHSNWKIATEPHHDDSVAAGKLPRILQSTGWSFEPGVEQRGPVIITRPSGHKIVITEPEGLDPITLFNTQYNSRRSSSLPSGLSFQSTPKEQQRGKRKVRFAKWQDIIPPVCTDLILYREFGPDSCLSYTAASRGGGQGVRGKKFDWFRLWIVVLLVAYLGLVLLGSSLSSSDEDFLGASCI